MVLDSTFVLSALGELNITYNYDFFHANPFREFKKPSDLVRHFRIHTKEKPFKCEECDRAFTVKSTLITHMKIHKNRSERQKPPCDKCGKIFYSHASYKAHLKQHDHPIECDMCTETFLTNGALNEHKHTVHKVLKRWELSDLFTEVHRAAPGELVLSVCEPQRS